MSYSYWYLPHKNRNSKDQERTTKSMSDSKAKLCKRCGSTTHWTYQCTEEEKETSRPTPTEQLRGIKPTKVTPTPMYSDKELHPLVWEKALKKAEEEIMAIVRKQKEDYEKYVEHQQHTKEQTVPNEAPIVKEETNIAERPTEEGDYRKEYSDNERQRGRSRSRHHYSCSESYSSSRSNSRTRTRSNRQHGRDYSRSSSRRKHYYSRSSSRHSRHSSRPPRHSRSSSQHSQHSSPSSSRPPYRRNQRSRSSSCSYTKR